MTTPTPERAVMLNEQEIASVNDALVKLIHDSGNDPRIEKDAVSVLAKLSAAPPPTKYPNLADFDSAMAAFEKVWQNAESQGRFPTVAGLYENAKLLRSFFQ